jgi:aromatic ring-opening dioxygenase catalytic subunit (LigB family)
MAELVLSLCASHAPMALAAPESAPAPQRDAWFEGMAVLRTKVREAAVDALVVVSNEHFTNFFLDAFPAVCIGVGEGHEGPVEPWLGVPRHRIAGQPALAHHLARSVMEAGFDPAVAHRLRLDHGFVSLLHQLDPSASLPLVPIVQNCAIDPMPSLARCAAFGRALADAVASHPEPLRVGLVGAGGLSHAVGTPEVGEIDESFDRWFLDHLVRGDLDPVLNVPDDELGLAGNGTHEIRSWVTVAAAAAPARARVLAYEPIVPWITGMGAVMFDG